MESEGVLCDGIGIPSKSSTTIELDHRQLLSNLRRFIEKWFLSRRDSTDESPDVQEIHYQIKNLIKLILIDGLLIKEENQQKLLNELHWLYSNGIRQEPSSSSNGAEFIDYQYCHYNSKNLEISSIYEWISASLKDSSLYSKLQLLVSDKELLHNYYSTEAFLRNEIYTTGLFICIWSLEFKQSSLLSQIDSVLINEKQMVYTKHRRSSSHPQFSISPKKYSLSTSKSTVTDNKNDREQKSNDTSLTENTHSASYIPNKKNLKEKCLSNESMNKNKRNFQLNRTWRSLSDLQKNVSHKRPRRSKTISQPISIPNNQSYYDWEQSVLNNSKKYNCLKENNSESTNSSDFIKLTSANSSKTSETNDLIPIQLVKCDDIKIYFDQSYCEKENNSFASNSLNENSIICYDSPLSSLESKGISGLSPLNLLSCMSANLFTSSDENLSKDSPNSFYHNGLLSAVPSTSNDFVSSFLPQQGEKLKARSYTNNIFEDFPEGAYDFSDYNNHQQSLAGQSLAAFLQNAQFSRNNTDLERENAHFKISEAIIAIIEYIKWSNIEKQLKQSSVSSSSSRNNNGGNGNHNYGNNKHGNQSNINNKSKCTTDESHMKASTSSLTDKDDSEDDDSSNNVEDDENHEPTILYKETNIEENYGSVDDHVAYAEWGETNLDALSAEGVALSLISKFSDSQLPKASDLTWLVSAEDAPQELLPMPESPAANPDDHFIHSFTRGTRDWAPPRQQIIFTNHPTPNRTTLLQKQKYRCAGCGMKVALMYANRFRYCTYLGKYMCTGCHRNQISTIPSKVLTKWDFSYYPVCVFSYRLLEQMWTYPLFYIPDLNPSLYTKIKNVYTGKLRRIQLKYIQDFIKSCRFADKEQKLFENIPTHLTAEPDKWAMSDFVAVKNCHLQKYIVELITKAEEHVFDCMLCTARGFICELCSKDQIIYPWQSRVKRCDKCGSCFHQKCWKDKPDCVKCQRLRRRQQLS